MIKLFTLFILLAFNFSNIQASEIFDACYKTLEINDRSVVPGPSSYNSQSSIFTIPENEFYYDLDTRKSLKTKVISLYTGHREGWYSFINPLIFEDLGNFEVDDHGLVYSYEGHVYHRNSHYGMDKVDFKTEVRLKKYVGIVTGLIKQSSKALDRHTNVEIILKEIACE